MPSTRTCWMPTSAAKAFLWNSSTGSGGIRHQSPINTWDDPIYAQLLATVREANRTGGHVRVLAGDPPIDWRKVQRVEECLSFLTDRDSHYASVVETEVLGRGRRGLLLIGGMHLLRKELIGVGARFPDMPIVMLHGGYGALNEEVEAVMPEWPAPSRPTARPTPLAGCPTAHPHPHIFS